MWQAACARARARECPGTGEWVGGVVTSLAPEHLQPSARGRCEEDSQRDGYRAPAPMIGRTCSRSPHPSGAGGRRTIQHLARHVNIGDNFGEERLWVSPQRHDHGVVHAAEPESPEALVVLTLRRASRPLHGRVVEQRGSLRGVRANVVRGGARQENLARQGHPSRG